jgi:hypothetical protein
LWSLVALATAWALPSRPALAIGILLAILWSAWTPPALFFGQAHWAFFLPWAVALFLTLRMSWLPGFHLTILTAWVWSALNAEALTLGLGIGRGDLAALYILVALALWLAGMRVSHRSLRFGSVMESYGLVVAFALIWILQAAAADSHVGMLWIVLALAGLAANAALIRFEMSAGRLALRDAAGLAAIGIGAALYPLVAFSAGAVSWVYAALLLALAAWLVAFGTGRRNRFALNAGFAAFAAEVLYLYFETLGTLLGTAAFFALGGIILIAGSFLIARLRRRVVAVADGGTRS